MFETWASRLRASRGDLLILGCLGVLIFTAGIGLRDPWPADEPRFALIADEMVESGSWFFPHRAGQLYPDKPPLFMWAIATSQEFTGSQRLAFLLPSLLSGFGILFLVYDLGRRLWHRRAGFAAGLALLAIVQFSLQVKTAQIDASVTFFTTLGLYGLIRHCLLGPSWRWWWIACAAMGFGIITKGVGFLPLLALIPWGVGRWLRWPSIPRFSGSFFSWALGPVILLAAVSTWLIPMLLLVAQSGDPELIAYRNNILWGQTAARYANFSGHQKPLWYYPVQVIPTLWLPISALLPWLIPAWARRLKRRDGRYLVLLGWIVAVVLFFTFSSGKRGVYILPAVPALALCCGPLLAAGIDKLTGPRRATLGLLALLSGCFLALAGASAADWIAPIRELGYGMEAPALLLTLGAVGTAAVALGCHPTVQKRGAFVVALAVFVALWQVYGWWAWPLLNGERSGRDLMQTVQQNLAPDTELAMVGWREQMILQSDRAVTHWGYWPENERSEHSEAQMERVASWLSAGKTGDRAAVVPADWLAPCFKEDAGIPIGRSHRLELRLVETPALTRTCPSREPFLPAYRSRRSRAISSGRNPSELFWRLDGR